MNIKKHKIAKHPAILHADDLAQICKPLQQLANIDYFSHVRVDRKGQFSGLSSNPAFSERYLEKQYYNADVHLVKNGVAEEYIMQDGVLHSGETGELFNECKQHSLNHLFTIIFRDDKFTNAYHFATSKPQAGFNEVYLRHLPILKNFIHYFNTTVQMDKRLRKAYQMQFQINMDEANYLSKYQSLELITDCNNDVDVNLKRYYLPSNQSVYLTHREIETLHLFHQGKTAPEVCKILNISERTVREHVNHAKEKLNCKTLFQLGEAFGKLSLNMFNEFSHD